MDFNHQQRSMYQRPQQTVQPRELGKISHPSDKEFHLSMLTQPTHSIATEWTDEKKPRSQKKRKTTEWPLEPPPVIALKIRNGSEIEHHNALTACPNVFCLATLTDERGYSIPGEMMSGRNSSSLIKLDKSKSTKLQTDSPAIGVFLFDFIHIRFPGKYCLLFTLFEMQVHEQGMHAVVHNVVRSEPFEVLPQPKKLPKPGPPADIILALAAQGAKIKIRKPSEEKTKKKQDWSIGTNEQQAFAQHAAQHAVQQAVMMPPMPPMHGHLQGHLQGQLPGLPMSMPPPGFMQQPMAMTTPQYEMPVPAHTSQALLMPQAYPLDLNFGTYQDPNQPFQFNAPYPQQNFGGFNQYQ